jgi:hypothetical protein
MADETTAPVDQPAGISLRPETLTKLDQVRQQMKGAEARAKQRHDDFAAGIRQALDSIRQESELDYQAIRQGQRELEAIVATDLAAALQPAAPAA